MEFELHVFDTRTGSRFWITLRRNNTIQHIKEKISRKLRVPLHQLRLIFRNKPLSKDHLTVNDYNITSHNELQVHYSLNDQLSDIPLAVRLKEPRELLQLCCDPNTDIDIQLQCATLIGSVHLITHNESLLTALCKQASHEPRRLKVLQKLADASERYNTRFYHSTGVDIVEKLNAFCDPCQHYETLLIVSQMLRKRCAVIGKKQTISFSDTLLHQLNLLLMYSGHEAIIINTIEAYDSLMGETCENANIKQIIQQSTESQKTLELQYSAKIEHDTTLFEGFMQNIHATCDIMVHKHVDDLMEKYYHCYTDTSHKYDLRQRLIDIAKVGSGYSNKIRHSALLTIYKLTKFGTQRILMQLIYNYSLLLTVRRILNNFELDGEVMRVIGVMLYTCAASDTFCLFNYDILEPLVRMFVNSGPDNQEPVIYILHILKEKIPIAKWLHLMHSYPLIQNICVFSTYSLWEKEAIKRALQIMEHLLGIKQRGISDLCVSFVLKIGDENIFQQVPSSDTEISSIANRIIDQYFTVNK